MKEGKKNYDNVVREVMCGDGCQRGGLVMKRMRRCFVQKLLLLDLRKQVCLEFFAAGSYVSRRSSSQTTKEQFAEGAISN